jgi:predicted O-methyltransferase YrrM
MHSPFVFTFITKVMNDNAKYPGYEKVERLRRQLAHDHTLVEVEDYGAGSVVDKNTQRKFSAIVNTAAKPPKYGQLLYRMVQYYNPKTILELGTSLGLTTAYLSLAGEDARLVTMEGAGSIADKALDNFAALGLRNVSLVRGNFDDTLAKTVNDLSKIDFAFIDGNHRREPTERYFRTLLPSLHNDSILVFDDIHWSPGMEQAWEAIKEHSSVRCTIDLFFIGIVLFRNEFKEKQHFVVRF